ARPPPRPRRRPARRRLGVRRGSPPGHERRRARPPGPPGRPRAGRQALTGPAPSSFSGQPRLRRGSAGYEAAMTSLRAGALGVSAALLSLWGVSPAAAAPVRFGTPVFVDQQLAGGEPLVLADKAHHTLIYTSHEG